MHCPAHKQGHLRGSDEETYELETRSYQAGQGTRQRKISAINFEFIPPELLLSLMDPITLCVSRLQVTEFQR